MLETPSHRRTPVLAGPLHAKSVRANCPQPVRCGRLQMEDPGVVFVIRLWFEITSTVPKYS
ncbi:hypothetical protein AVEN_211518-1, partial [Araneus ventricosus]